MRLHFYTFPVQNFFDFFFGWPSEILAQKWPFGTSQRFLGPNLTYLQRFENTYPEYLLKLKKTKNQTLTGFPMNNFFHIATKDGALG